MALETAPDVATALVDGVEVDLEVEVTVLSVVDIDEADADMISNHTRSSSARQETGCLISSSETPK